MKALSRLLIPLLFCIGAPHAADSAYLLKDTESQQILHWANIDIPLNPGVFAEIASVYTALSVLSKHNPDNVSKNLDSHSFFLDGERETLQTLISSTGLTNEDFVSAMNAECLAVGMSRTNFVSPFVSEDPAQRTTASDIAKLADALRTRFPDACDTKTDLFRMLSEKYSAADFSQPTRTLANFLAGGETNGRWNGLFFTENPVSKSLTRHLFTVVMDAESLEELVQRANVLIRSGNLDFDTMTLFDQGEHIGELPVYKGKRSTLPLRLNQKLIVTVPRETLQAKGEEAFKMRLTHKKTILAPVKENTQIGTLTVSFNGKDIASAPVFASENLEEGNLWIRFRDTVKLALRPNEEEIK